MKYLHLKQELVPLIKTKNALIRQLQPWKKLMDLEGVAEVCAGMLYSRLVMENSSRMVEKHQNLLD